MKRPSRNIAFVKIFHTRLIHILFPDLFKTQNLNILLRHFL